MTFLVNMLIWLIAGVFIMAIGIGVGLLPGIVFTYGWTWLWAAIVAAICALAIGPILD